MVERYEGEDAGREVKEWLARNHIPFETLEHQGMLTLRERLSRKHLRFAVGQVIAAEYGRQEPAGSRYLRVVLDDGRSFALSPLGLVFAPSFLATGPIPDCPPTACLLDYEKLARHLDHLTRDDHEEHEREALQTLMVLLAFLEGARLLGLDVAEEERALEPLVDALTGRRSTP